MRRLRKLIAALAALGAVAVAVVWMLGRGWLGHMDSDTLAPVPVARPRAEVVAARDRQQRAASAVGADAGDRQILFGDLHVHTTISFDAFMLNLPVLGGQGAAPPADACDFARHCAALDFWSINDHAANILPRDWRNTIESIRQCNALAGDTANPDTVAFLGWEWTQAGRTPDTHYGHKNVVLAHTDDARIPSRPIAATMGGVASNPPPVLARGLLAASEQRFRDLAARWTALSEIAPCPDGSAPELPPNCREVAPTPADLFRKLDEWGHESIVIPHGTTWGIYTPPGSTWDKQIEGTMHDPARQTLLEIYSGHGDGEVYRSWRAIERDGEGRAVCPEAGSDYLPMCRRAGEIIERRCLEEGESSEECARRAADARRNAAAAGVSPHVTVPGATGADWLDAGQCRDCSQPAFKYRPGGSAQYIAALGDFAGGGDRPRRFRMGFIASSDIHSARPGTGYKELRRLSETPDRPRPDSGGIAGSFFTAAPEPAEARSRPIAEALDKLSGLQLYESERTRSFLYTGGLVAVHSAGRDRDAIWAALKRKEVYGTSGPRILLWFDLIQPDRTWPMGSELATATPPVFRVRAVGSLEQAPGCPPSVAAALGAERVASLCGGECYRPTDERRTIARIEIVRIRPRLRADEDVATLIDDPWRRFDCPPDPAGCVASFTDDEFPSFARDTVYYARVREEPAPTVNGRPLRCRAGADGPCEEIDLCGDGDDCLDPHAARAWSSPIYVDYAR
jgi:hypothetical protein